MIILQVLREAKGVSKYFCHSPSDESFKEIFKDINAKPILRVLNIVMYINVAVILTSNSNDLIKVLAGMMCPSPWDVIGSMSKG